MDYMHAYHPLGEDGRIGNTRSDHEQAAFTVGHAEESLSGSVFSVSSMKLLRQAAVRVASLWRGQELCSDWQNVSNLRGDIGDTMFMTPHDGGIWTEVVPPIITASIGELNYMMEHEGLFGGLYACLGGNAMDTEGAITIKAFHEAREITIETITLDEGRAWMRSERKKRERLHRKIMDKNTPVGTQMQKRRIGRRVERLRPSE